MPSCYECENPESEDRPLRRCGVCGWRFCDDCWESHKRDYH